MCKNLFGVQSYYFLRQEWASGVAFCRDHEYKDCLGQWGSSVTAIVKSNAVTGKLVAASVLT